jgi:hypothetical protein
MEDIEHYHPTLIDMKEQYWRDVEMLVKETKKNSNHMHFCMYFGGILSYIDGGKAHKNASGIPWRWEVPITRFDIMAQNIKDVSWQFTKDVRECKHRLDNTS